MPLTEDQKNTIKNNHYAHIIQYLGVFNNILDLDQIGDEEMEKFLIDIVDKVEVWLAEIKTIVEQINE